MQDVYKNIERCNRSRKYNNLILFDDMIPHMISNKKLSLIVTELFIIKQKLNISTAFIIKFSF